MFWLASGVVHCALAHAGDSKKIGTRIRTQTKIATFVLGFVVLMFVGLLVNVATVHHAGGLSRAKKYGVKTLKRAWGELKIRY
jgi:hypothetical protein